MLHLAQYIISSSDCIGEDAAAAAAAGAAKPAPAGLTGRHVSSEGDNGVRLRLDTASALFDDLIVLFFLLLKMEYTFGFTGLFGVFSSSSLDSKITFLFPLAWVGRESFR